MGKHSKQTVEQNKTTSINKVKKTIRNKHKPTTSHSVKQGGKKRKQNTTTSKHVGRGTSMKTKNNKQATAKQIQQGKTITSKHI